VPLAQLLRHNYVSPEQMTRLRRLSNSCSLERQRRLSWRWGSLGNAFPNLRAGVEFDVPYRERKNMA
jgi:hypothetical protein